MTCEELSRHIPNSQSTYKYVTDRITTKRPKELSDNQQAINARSPVYYNAIKPTIMQTDIQHHTKQATESQGEEFVYYIQHAEAPSEKLDSSLDTAVQADEFCNLLQTATDESEESTLRTPTDQSEALHRSIQIGRPTAQSKHHTNHLEISTEKSDKFCNPLKTLQSEEPFKSTHIATVKTKKPSTPSQTVTVQSKEPFKSLKTAIVQSEEPITSSHAVTVQSEELFTSSHTATVQSEEPFKSMTAIVQSDELCGSFQMSDALSVKPFDGLQTEHIHSEGHCNSLRTATDQPEELNRPRQTSPVQSKELDDLPNTPSFQSLDSYNSKAAQTVQFGDHYNLQQCALDNLYHTGQAAPSHSEVLYQSMQAITAPAKCHQPMTPTEDQADGIVNSGQRSSTQFAESYNVEETSTAESEEIYLSCDIHWSDSVTANKVAVEGDLMASIIKQKIDGRIVDIVQNEVIAFSNP